MRDKYYLLDQVSLANLKRDVTLLSNRWPTRHTLSKHHPAIAATVAERMKQLGYGATLHSYEQQGKRLLNVIADKPGPKHPAILLCAHFDSRQQRLNEPEAPAPGADDNATGVAIIWELARLLHPIALKVPLRFAFFSGEEQGLWGSTAYAGELAEKKTPLELVFNVDQVGYPRKDLALFLDRD